MKTFRLSWIADTLCPLLRLDSGSSPSSPPPPDPVKTIQAQAKATPSAFTPAGSKVYSGDPGAGTYRYTETLSPELQKQFDLRNRLAESMLARGNANAAQLPEGPLRPGMDSEGTKAYWDRERTMLDQTFDRSDRQREQKLANQGLPIGSEAYSDEMTRAEQTKADAYERAAQGALGAGFQQDLSSRQQNYNELAAALAGQQTGQSSVGQTGGQSFVDPQAAIDLEQAGVNRQYQGQLAGYNADVASNNTNTQAGATLGAAALLAFY